MNDPAINDFEGGLPFGGLPTAVTGVRILYEVPIFLHFWSNRLLNVERLDHGAQPNGRNFRSHHCRPLPNGITIRGPGQYRARKLVNGQRITKTFTSAKLASRWLSEIEVDRSRGVFLDRSEAERKSLGDIILTYETEILGENSEKRGTKQELGSATTDHGAHSFG